MRCDQAQKSPKYAARRRASSTRHTHTLAAGDLHGPLHNVLGGRADDFIKPAAVGGDAADLCWAIVKSV